MNKIPIVYEEHYERLRKILSEYANAYAEIESIIERKIGEIPSDVDDEAYYHIYNKILDERDEEKERLRRETIGKLGEILDDVCFETTNTKTFYVIGGKHTYYTVKVGSKRRGEKQLWFFAEFHESAVFGDYTFKLERVWSEE